jgi:hypothetical protein
VTLGSVDLSVLLVQQLRNVIIMQRAAKLDISFLLCDNEKQPISGPSAPAPSKHVTHPAEVIRTTSRKSKTFACSECSRLFSEKGNLNK